jgi:hypothetical protein
MFAFFSRSRRSVSPDALEQQSATLSNNFIPRLFLALSSIVIFIFF